MADEVHWKRIMEDGVKERLPCEFFLIRYVPDVVKGEFANIGVLLREATAAPGRDERAVVQFTRDWSRVRCMDAAADISMLEALEAEIAARLRMGANDIKPVMQVLEDTLANSLQITEARACLAESIPAELGQLMRMYVEPIRVKTERRRTGRAAIAAAMRTEFERAGVWGLMRKRIAASLYTAPGDPMRLDCGYRGDAGTTDANGVIRIFQAVSLEGDIEAAKVLAWTAPQLRDGVARIEHATLDLTAIVEPASRPGDSEADETDDAYRFGIDAMERQAIRVMTVADLARIAETARLELRM